jgi:hypothetical protein
MARKGPFSILAMLVAPSGEHGGMDLMLVCRLGRGVPGVEFADHREFACTGNATSFESQGWASFRSCRKLKKLSEQGVHQGKRMSIQGLERLP